MLQKVRDEVSLSEVHESVDTTVLRHLPWWKRMFAFFGPAYLVSVGYMDPGNWATDLAGGSRFGYALIWVLLMSNLMAILLQSLSARLGIVAGRDLAQANRETYPKKVNFILYLLAEVAIAATDLAEVLGMAIGINLLTGLNLLWGVGITVFDTFLLLFLQRYGMRVMEAFIISLVAIIGFSFLIEIILAKPNPAEIASGFIPSVPDKQALYIAIGIIGATVMPHNLYLHSALVQSRKIKRDPVNIRSAIKWNIVDSTIALNLAFFVNAAILILSAAVFFKTGRTEVAEIKEAHQLLAPLLGSSLAPKLFAIALIAAGQSSTITGTLSGQIVMEGYLRLRINPWVRRLVTRLLAIIPAVVVILIYGEQEVDSLLVLSQVVLSMQLGFAIIPLIHFVSSREKMGTFAIGPITKTAAWLITTILIYLNVRMVIEQSSFYFTHEGFWIQKILILAAYFFFGGLFLYITGMPVMGKKKRAPIEDLHPEPASTLQLQIPAYKKVAVALEFSNHDPKLISAAIGQGGKDTTYLLLHVVESASARWYGNLSHDLESQKDQERLDHYQQQLIEKGYRAETRLGFSSRAKEIVRIVRENESDLLVIGGHGHKAFKDVLLGETINTVRHELKIPVLVIHV